MDVDDRQSRRSPMVSSTLAAVGGPQPNPRSRKFLTAQGHRTRMCALGFLNLRRGRRENAKRSSVKNSISGQFEVGD
jgi:hypothetical protein